MIKVILKDIVAHVTSLHLNKSMIIIQIFFCSWALNNGVILNSIYLSQFQSTALSVFLTLWWCLRHTSAGSVYPLILSHFKMLKAEKTCRSNWFAVEYLAPW